MERLLGALLALPLLVPSAASGAALDVNAVLEAEASDTESRAAELAAVVERLLRDGSYSEAVAPAREALELARTRGPTALASAFANLGRAQLGAGDADGASSSLTSALDFMSESETIASPRPIPVLADLAEAQALQGDLPAALASLELAIATSHRALGLYNLRQLPMLRRLAGLYDEVGSTRDADRSLQLAILVAERNYGAEDLRMIPLWTALAEWYERTGRLALARDNWRLVAHLAGAESGGRNAASVDALLGISRTHRLQYGRDPASIPLATCPVNEVTGQPLPLAVCTGVGELPKPDPEGQAAALRAMALLESVPDAPAGLLARTALELGDWAMTTGRTAEAIENYRRAWSRFQSLAPSGVPNPMLEPRLLVYRAPVPARRYAGGQPQSNATLIEFGVTVQPDGTTADIVPLSQSPEARLMRVRKSLERAIYGPRFQDGRPVPTRNHRFLELWYEMPPVATG